MKDALEAAAEARLAGRTSVLVTVIGVGGSAPRHAGSRMLVYPDGDIAGTIGGGPLEHRVVHEALEVLREGRPRRWIASTTRDLGMCCGGQVEVFMDPIAVLTPITVFGAGHVALATVPLLQSLDFDVDVVDERPDLAHPERFPSARVHCVDALHYAERSSATERTHWLVITHDHALDQHLIEILVRRPGAWIGLIGSESKIKKFRYRLRAAGFSNAELARIRGPVGLDLQAETPAEIAVSIAAELIALRRGAPLPAPAMCLPEL